MEVNDTLFNVTELERIVTELSLFNVTSRIPNLLPYLSSDTIEAFYHADIGLKIHLYMLIKFISVKIFL